MLSRQSTKDIDELMKKLTLNDVERLISLTSKDFGKENFRTVLENKDINDEEIDLLLNELDRGVTNVLENQLVKNQTMLSEGLSKMIRFKTTAGARRASEIGRDIVQKTKLGLVVFIDDNFINH